MQISGKETLQLSGKYMLSSAKTKNLLEIKGFKEKTIDH
jgi:hypothetical protein